METKTLKEQWDEYLETAKPKNDKKSYKLIERVARKAIKKGYTPESLFPMVLEE